MKVSRSSETKPSPKASSTKSEGTEPYKIYKAILGVGFPLHKPYPYSFFFVKIPPF